MTTRTRVIAPLATVAAVAAIVAAATLLPGRGGSDRPPVLLLSGSAGSFAATDAARSSSGGYTVTGELPQGTPPDAPVWTFEGTDGITALRQVLGQGVRLSHQAWSWSSCTKDLPAPEPSEDDGSISSVGCAVATPVTPGTAPRPALDREAVRSKAKPVFDALGFDVAKATVTTSEYGGSVVLPLTAGALRTSGYLTSVGVDDKNELQYASGFVGEPKRGDDYPLITAQAAVDTLPVMPRMDVCQVAPGGTGCIEPPTPEITGAEVGLLLVSTTKGEQLLAPAWLFSLKGSIEPLAQLAIDPAFLGTEPAPTAVPEPNQSDPGQTEPGTGGGTDPAPPKPSAVPPVPPGDSSPEPREPLAFDSAYRGSTAASVVVQFGQSGSCPRTNVTHSVKESPEAIWVVLTADSYPPDQACTADYHPVKVTVVLAAPLGDRKVYDASRNAEVRLS